MGQRAGAEAPDGGVLEKWHMLECPVQDGFPVQRSSYWAEVPLGHRIPAGRHQTP